MLLEEWKTNLETVTDGVEFRYLPNDDLHVRFIQIFVISIGDEDESPLLKILHNDHILLWRVPSFTSGEVTSRDWKNVSIKFPFYQVWIFVHEMEYDYNSMNPDAQGW